MSSQQNSPKRPVKWALAAAMLAVAGFGTLQQVDAPWAETLRATTSLTSPAHAASAPLPMENGSTIIADVVDRVGPAVVTVHVTQKVGANAGDEDGAQAPFEEFFRRFFEGDPRFQGAPRSQPRDQQARPAPRAERKVQGLGSGFIIDKSGRIVTNNHVVEDADEITVELSDGRKLKAELVGRDEKTDLALLKIDAKGDLPTVAFGDSDAARVGEWVVAIGNPFGVGQTATAGIVSAHHRNIGAGPYDDFLQLDAPINRGNSGGPTVNLKGEVIGVNTAIFSPSGGSVGIGFAIPSNLAKQIIHDLNDKGSVDRGWLGVQIQEVTPEIADNLKLKEAKGALVAKVEKDSPAASAKLLPGDVITHLNGAEVKSVRDLPRLVANIKAGETSKFAVWRDGKEQQFAVKIGKAPSAEEMAKADRKDGEVAGMQLGSLDQQMRQSLGIQDGVIITSVVPGSAADKSGLDRGDVIVAIGNKPVANPGDVAKEVASAEKAQAKSVLLRVVNRQGTQFVALPVGKA